MGENKHIKELDAFAKKYVKEIPKEKISADFTKSVMNTVLKESNSKNFNTKALISKKGWFVISILFSAVVFIPFKASENTFRYFPKLDFSILNRFQISSLFESITISNTVLYAVFLFGVMIIAQLFFLKNYFDKRFH